MTSPEVLHIAAARLVLSLLGPEDLPQVAASALAAGLDSPSLRVVAGLSASEAGDAERFFADALQELGIGEVSKQEALLLLARMKAREVLLGETSPIAAARQIWDLTLTLDDEEVVPELDSFIYAASEWDERPDDRKDFESGIIDAARSLLNASN